MATSLELWVKEGQICNLRSNTYYMVKTVKIGPVYSEFSLLKSLFF